MPASDSFGKGGKKGKWSEAGKGAQRAMQTHLQDRDKTEELKKLTEDKKKETLNLKAEELKAKLMNSSLVRPENNESKAGALATSGNASSAPPASPKTGTVQTATSRVVTSSANAGKASAGVPQAAKSGPASSPPASPRPPSEPVDLTSEAPPAFKALPPSASASHAAVGSAATPPARRPVQSVSVPASTPTPRGPAPSGGASSGGQRPPGRPPADAATRPPVPKAGGLPPRPQANAPRQAAGAGVGASASAPAGSASSHAAVASTQESQAARLASAVGNLRDPPRKKPRLAAGEENLWDAELNRLLEWGKQHVPQYMVYSKPGATLPATIDLDKLEKRYRELTASPISLS